ncbi:DNA polymerase III subunit delta [Hephaestia sp. GCM10023244]|uniref:DNA polymerase III subunit delta n=1 Tax=unclassified Hephaestia TaxID=2631281 RepID=UPI00207747B6|nr:DNA polymerase III subunit delta [Hephaestia sp. MAHUQ-44]
MKANANQIRAALDAPSADIRLFLLHGPDEAGAAELGLRLARAMGPEAERIDLEPAMLKSDPGRLADEAASISLFGGARHLRVLGAGEDTLEAFTLLLGAEQAGNPVIAIAPNVKASGKIVKLAIQSPRAMAFACYVPDGADADRMVAQIARDHGLRTTGDTARRLASASGGDRAIVAREIEKLALYLDAGPDRPGEIDDAALDEIGADLGEAEMSRAIAAAVGGDVAVIGPELARLRDAGVSPIPLLRGLVRRLMTIAALRAEIDAGGAIDAVMERNRVFFREKAATARAIRTWSPTRIQAAIDRIRTTERAIMAPGTAGDILAEQTFLSVARLAARNR